MRRTFLFAAAPVALLPGSQAWGFRTKRDAAWVPSDPQAFEVSLGFDNGGRYTAPIGMGDQNKAGNFSFVLSTASPYTAVAAAGCANCAAQAGQAPVYNLSSSAFRQGINQSIDIGDGNMAGEQIRETCSFKKVSGGSWTYPNQSVVMIQNTTGVLSEGVSGFIGLGRSTGNDSLMSGIINGRGWKNLTFGFAFNGFNASSTTTQSAGSFTVRELNPRMFAGEVAWQPLAQVSGVPTTMPTDWAIKFDSYKITSGSQSTTNLGGVAIIDTYFRELRIPRDEAIEFFGNMTGTKMTDNNLSLGWEVPCDQDLSISVTIGSSTYRMKKEQLISTDASGTVCTSLVKGWSDPTVRAYLFGTPFASIAYIAYNAHRDKSSDQIGLAPRSVEITTNQAVSRTLLIAAITGSVVLTLFIIAAIVFFFYHKRRGSDKGDGAPTVEGKYRVEPFTAGVPNSAVPSTAVPNSATPMLSTTARSRSNYIIEQGPIGGEPSEGSVSARQSQYTDFTPTSDTTPHLSSAVRTPQSFDSKRARHSMRQSQYMDGPTFSPIPEATSPLEVHHAAVPSPSLNQAFPQPQQDLAPEESAPPPYVPRPESAAVHTPASPVRQKN